MFRRALICAIVLFGIGSAGFAFATDQNSANYQNKDSTFAPAVFDATSPNFRVNGSLESIVGAATNLNFKVQSGVTLNETVPIPPPPPPPPPPPSGGGGSGGGGGTLPVSTSGTVGLPTLEYPPYTFKSSKTIHGTRDAASTQIWVNGSTDGVRYPDGLHWERDLPLFLGVNTIIVQAIGQNGARSAFVGGSIERILIGDVSRNHVVDDVDLSLFTRAWKVYTPFADFNEDGIIDDVDLSLLASHWGMSF
jgi:hypothetical protein